MIYLYVVSNASPIIFSSFIPRLLELLRKEYEKIVISKEVYKECVVEGLKSEDPEVKRSAIIIKKLVDEKFIQIKNLKGRWLKLRDSLLKDVGIGESSAIALALQEKINSILMDDKKGTAIAEEFKLESRPISLLPIVAFRKKWIRKDETTKLLDELLVKNYHLSSEAYKKIISLLEE